jgi:tRNA(Ser,Leu) C12 N-acetylase TAN1
LAATSKAREVIRARHNLASSDDLSGYISEIREELVNQIKNVLAEMDLDGTEIAETINNTIQEKVQ